MNALTSLDEDSLFLNLHPLSEEPASHRWGGRRWGIARWVGVGALVMAVAVGHGIRESRRQRCADQLQRLGLAFQEYHEANGHFPAPALARRDGTPLLSWRVALLPYLGYQSLYERFHLDEPWDSPHNRALLAEMPAELTCPGGPGRRAGRTGYLVVVGPKNDTWNVSTPFEPARGVDIREITDGTSNTALVFETDSPVPWTKPEDLHWAQGGPLPHLASPHRGGAFVLFADGAARFLGTTIPSARLQALLTINGGEVVSA